MRHLWEINHPFYGCSYRREEFDSFEELRRNVGGHDEDMNFIYRWDWHDFTQSHYDSLFADGEDRSKQEFSVCVLMPRKDIVVKWVCPISREEEDEVLEWLRSSLVLGTLRKWWEPILGTES